MEYTKRRKLELTEVLGSNVVKGKGKQEKDETFKEKATSNWSDLPSDIMSNILQRLDAVVILEGVRKVCTNWRQICKDPCMWRVIYMDDNGYHEQGHNYNRYVSYSPSLLQDICKNLVDKSEGQLVDITMKRFCDDKLLQYVAERSSQLRRLEIGFNKYAPCNLVLSKALKKFPLLEELSLNIQIREEAIQTLGRECPMLKTLKLSKQFGFQDDALGLAIAGNLPGLRHLQLKWCKLTHTGLQAILDKCCHLHVLDLQRCYPVYLMGELRERCSQQIKCVKLPPNGL